MSRTLGEDFETLRAILESSPDIVTLLDAQGTILYLNRAVPPRKVSDVVGTSSIDHLPPEERARWREAVRRVAVEQTPQRLEITSVSGFHWETRLVPIRSTPPAAVMAVATDVTPRKNLEADLRHAQKMEAIGQLTAGIAHNFNNLLTAILPNLELAATAPPAESRLHLRDAESAARKASEMVRQLLLFARKEPSTPHAPVDLRAVVDHTLDLCLPILGRTMHVRWPRPEAAHVAMADEWQIEQALVNVLLNAKDAVDVARRDRPFVEITLGTEGGMHRIRVRDNGIGMDEGTRQRVFEPFFTTKDVGRGTGLGLAVTYAIASEHGGRVTCESAPGEGTTVSIWVPAHAER